MMLAAGPNQPAAESAQVTNPIRAALNPTHGTMSNPFGKLHEQANDADDQFDVLPVTHDDTRSLKRRALMLDDGCLQTATIQCRKYDGARVAAYTALCFVTVGTVAIIAYWQSFRKKKELLLSGACAPEDADFVIVDAPDGAYEVCPVEEVKEIPLELLPYMEAQQLSRSKPPNSIPLARRMYVYRHTRYRYRPSARAFVQVECEEVQSPADPGAGLDSAQARQRLVMLGRNVIDVPIPPVPVLLVREVLHPFVIFQVWAVIVWLTEAYWSFSIFILCTALLTAGLNLRDVLRNLTDIRNLSRYVTTVTVLRDGGRRVCIPSDQLVPGDVMVVPRNLKLPADLVLVQGQATVTEAMLTGEATVVIKTPVVPNASVAEDFASAIGRADMRNTLFGGTQVVELRVPKGQDVLAVVVRTGYETVKGRLVLSILHPKSSHFKFMDEAIRFVGILFGCAMLGFIVNAKALADNGAGPEKIVQRGADLITIVVPPALPLAVTVGTLYALMALRKDRIFCISPPKVNLAGKINCFCFDKTGTLTTEGLELATLRPAVQPQSQAAAGTSSAPLPLSVDTTALAGAIAGALPPSSTDGGSDAMSFGNGSTFLPDTDRPSELSMHFSALLACCHSLTHVSGVLSGDPLELKTFQFTQARLKEPHTAEEGQHGHGHGASSHGGHAAGAQDAVSHDAVGIDVHGQPVHMSAGVAGHWDGTSSASLSSGVSSGQLHGTNGASGKAQPTGAVPAHVVSRVYIPPSSSLRDQPGGAVRTEFTSYARGGGSVGPLGPSSGSTAPAAVDVLHVFGFVPALQRMGVLVQPVDSVGGASSSSAAPVVSYVKGSPESIHALCDAASLPGDFWAILDGYAKKGLRVLGAGYKLLPPAHASNALRATTDAAYSEELRSDVERGLTFLGFIVLENRLKPETAPTLARLRREAGLSMHMATGDNGVSAIAIARQCGLVERGARVFLADIGNNGNAADDGVTWTDVDDPSNSLDPLTLLPRAPLAPLSIEGPTANCSALGSASGHSAAGSQVQVQFAGGEIPESSLSPAALIQKRSAAGRVPKTNSSGGNDDDASDVAGPGVYRLAMTGRAFEALSRQVAAGALPARTLARALVNCSVFARMSPENKASLVESLQAQGLYVGMIGDGANDSMALRAAHVGISLSQVEASVAAPFTYAVPNPSIDAIPRVLAEGRGALATSFCLFQFMALYSTIQFATAVQIAFSGSFLSNNMYLFQDLFVVFILSFSLGQTPSARALTHKRPSGRLGSVYNLTITFGFIILTFILQAIAYFMVRGKPWFGSKAYPAAMDKDQDSEGTNSAIPETTSLFLMANFQYVACAIIFSYGYPWKQTPLTNKVFCGWLGIVALTSIALLLGPSAGAYSLISLQILPMSWHGELFGLSIVAFLSYFVFMYGIRKLKDSGFFSKLERRGPPKLHKELRTEWRQQFASAASNSMAAISVPLSASGAQTTAGAGTGQSLSVGIRRNVHSGAWNTANSLIEPSTPLPVRLES